MWNPLASLFSRICTAPQEVIFFRLVNARKSDYERTKFFREFMSRFSCVGVQTFVRSPDYRAFVSRLSCVQTFIRVSRPCKFERTTPLRAFILVWTYPASVWDLNLGCQCTNLKPRILDDFS